MECYIKVIYLDANRRDVPEENLILWTKQYLEERCTQSTIPDNIHSPINFEQQAKFCIHEIGSIGAYCTRNLEEICKQYKTVFDGPETSVEQMHQLIKHWLDRGITAFKKVSLRTSQKNLHHDRLLVYPLQLKTHLNQVYNL